MQVKRAFGADSVKTGLCRRFARSLRTDESLRHDGQTLAGSDNGASRFIKIYAKSPEGSLERNDSDFAGRDFV